MDAQTALSWESPTVPRFRLSLVRETETPYGAGDSFAQPGVAASWLWQHIFFDEPREVLAAVYLDAKHNVVGYSVCFMGGLSRAAVEPRGILVPGLLMNAAGVLIAHNHPSGDPSPSADDLLFTRRLAEAGEVVGLKLVDHLILGDRACSYVSLNKRGAV